MAKIDFGWTYSDPAHPDATFALYENGKQVVKDLTGDSFSLLMDGKPEGDYSYYATAIDPKTHLESTPSNSVVVNFHKPAAPTGFKGSWA